jgi:hypothetical protein
VEIGTSWFMMVSKFSEKMEGDMARKYCIIYIRCHFLFLQFVTFLFDRYKRTMSKGFYLEH